LLAVGLLLTVPARKDRRLAQPNQWNGPAPYTVLTIAKKPVADNGIATASVSESGDARSP
jgi:hypothetical protein